MLGLGRRIKLNSTLCQVSALEGPHIYIILANPPEKNFVKNQKLNSAEKSKYWFKAKTINQPLECIVAIQPRVALFVCTAHNGQ